MAVTAEVEPSEPKEKKARIKIKESDLKGIIDKGLSDKVSILVSGTICEISEGYEYEDKKSPYVVVEIDEIAFADKSSEEKKEDE